MGHFLQNLLPKRTKRSQTARLARKRPQRRGTRLESLETRNLLASVPFGAQPDDTALYMIGDVRVNVVFLESDGSQDTSSEDWNEAHRNEVKQNIVEGLDWWEQAFDATGLTGDLNFEIDFHYADNPVPTPYEPISRISNDYELWTEDFLTHVGANTPDDLEADIRAFNHAERLEHDTDWAFTIFVVNSENDNAINGEGRFASGGSHSRAFAFAGGLFFVMPSTRPASTVAHEAAHIFYAYDEYNGAASYYASRGYLEVQNLNGRTSHPDPTSRVMSIMDAHELAYPLNAISPSAADMIGWRDSDGDSIADILDVAHTLTGVGSYDSATETYQFDGYSQVNTLPNLNPWDSSLQSDVTLNQLSRIEYRLDGGDWTSIASLNSYTAELGITIANVPATATEIEIRTIDDWSGVASNVFTATLDQPAATGEPGINGFVWHDLNADGVWNANEPALEGWGVDVLDSQANPIAAPVSIVANDFASNQVINTATPGVTLSAIGFGVWEDTIRTRDRDGSPGEQIFKHFIGTGWSSSWTYGNGIAQHNRQLKIEFDAPVTTISVDAIANSDHDFGRLEIYDANDNLLGRYTTDELSADQVETMTLSTATPVIAYALASGHANTGVDLNNIRFGAENTVQTAAGGDYSASHLQPGLYRLRAESRAGFEFTTDSEHLQGYGNGATIQNVNFGVVIGLPPWQNTDDPFDVDRSGVITLNDVLEIVSALRHRGPHVLEGEPGETNAPLIDTNGDGLLSLTDALEIIQYLRSQQSNGEGESGLISEGEGEEVQFNLQTTDLAGNPITSVDVGDEFLLNVFVQDLRGDSFLERGIQVAFLDILYDASPVSPVATPGGDFPIDIIFSSDFQHTPDLISASPGLINDVGALQTNPGAAAPLGAEPVLLLTVRFEAVGGGEVLFQADDADEPGNTVNFFEPPQPEVNPSVILYNTTTLTVVQPLEANDDSFSVAVSSGANSLNVRQNDVSGGSFVVDSVGSTASGGTVSVAPGGATVNYTPPAGFTGFDAFDYTIRAGSLTSTARVQVTVGSPAPPYRNTTNPLDVDVSGAVTLNDALLVVADLRTNGVHSVVLPPTAASSPPPFLDVTGDNTISISDALQIISHLRNQSNGEPEGESLELVSTSDEEQTIQPVDQIFADWSQLGLDDDTAARLAAAE